MDKAFIPLSVPNLKGNELAYVTEAVRTEWVSTGGPYVNDFERVIAEYVHIPGAVSCQNGTSGIHTALLLAGVTAEDEVLVPTLTFIAAVNPVRYVGAEPVFMDCDNSLCMDADKLEDFCSNECEMCDGNLIDKVSHKHVKALIVVHVFGNMANLERILDIANVYNIKVIEDATEAIGTYYLEGVYAGKYAGTLGLMGIYSFNGNKIITTGGGGMMVSNDPGLLWHAKHLTTQAKSDEVNFLHDEVGFNYRMTNLQAALGLAQMEQLEVFITKKEENYQLYKKALGDISHLRFLPFRSDIRSNHWFYSLLLEDEFPLSRDEVIENFTKSKIQTRPIWGLIHEQIPYAKFRAYKIEKAVYYQRRVINLPCSTNLQEREVIRVVECLKGMVG
ncbi:MAG: LegC family aminotransferase [Sphaerochaeta sp.]|nr:LegC family aminotransferase [Sphaerochaeta sp.]NCB96815.1 LegC family aminotransferase [Bacteroidia bacterium]